MAGGVDLSKTKSASAPGGGKKKSSSLVPPAPIIGMAGAVASSSKSPARPQTARPSVSSPPAPAKAASAAVSLPSPVVSAIEKAKAAAAKYKVAARRHVSNGDDHGSDDDDAFAGCKAVAADDWVMVKQEVPKGKAAGPAKGVPVGMAPVGRGGARPMSARK